MASSETLPALRLAGIAYGVPGINLYRLASPDGAPLPAFEPGAHIDLHIGQGTVRQYSLLWPPPSTDCYEIAVRETPDGRGGSQAWHRETVVGQLYPVSPPRNHFPLHEAQGAPTWLFAGGIGITPIIAMFRKLLAEKKPVTLHYWTRSEQAALFRDELKAAPAGSVHCHHTEKVAPRLADILADVPPDAMLYCCGPARMIDAFDALTQRRPPERVHRERFSAASPEAGPKDSFTIRLARTGRSLEIGPDETILSACLEAGLDLSYSCEEGVCGACEVKVLSGQVDHRDQVLSPAARAASATMMVCCSRGITDLELDL
jgi:ferredoxin-NADP reductase